MSININTRWLLELQVHKNHTSIYTVYLSDGNTNILSGDYYANKDQSEAEIGAGVMAWIWYQAGTRKLWDTPHEWRLFSAWWSFECMYRLGVDVRHPRQLIEKLNYEVYGTIDTVSGTFQCLIDGNPITIGTDIEHLTPHASLMNEINRLHDFYKSTANARM